MNKINKILIICGCFSRWNSWSKQKKTTLDFVLLSDSNSKYFEYSSDSNSQKINQSGPSPKKFNRLDPGPKKFNRLGPGPKKFNRFGPGPKKFNRLGLGPNFHSYSSLLVLDHVSQNLSTV